MRSPPSPTPVRDWLAGGNGAHAGAVTGEVKNFAFDHSIWSTNRRDKHFRGQEFVYNNLGTHLIENAFEGYNACLFAYGQTGSGARQRSSPLKLQETWRIFYIIAFDAVPDRVQARRTR